MIFIDPSGRRWWWAKGLGGSLIGVIVLPSFLLMAASVMHQPLWPEMRFAQPSDQSHPVSDQALPIAQNSMNSTVLAPPPTPAVAGQTNAARPTSTHLALAASQANVVPPSEESSAPLGHHEDTAQAPTAPAEQSKPADSPAATDPSAPPADSPPLLEENDTPSQDDDTPPVAAAPGKSEGGQEHGPESPASSQREEGLSHNPTL